MWKNSSSARKLEEDFWNSLDQTQPKLRYTVNKGFSETNIRGRPDFLRRRNRSVLLEPKPRSVRGSGELPSVRHSTDLADTRLNPI